MDKGWVREEACLILNKVVEKGAYSNIEVRNRLNSSGLERQDKALVTEIVNGTLRNLIYIDWIIKKFSSIKDEKISQNVKSILRCGIYQIMFLDRVPASAVCNESVELAKKYSNIGSSKYVNGLLRSVARNKEKIGYPDKSNPAEYLSVKYSHPLWLAEIWMKDYGIEFCEELMKANNETPPFTIRINRLRKNKSEVRHELEKQDIACTDGMYNEEALNIRGTSSIERLDLFREGCFSVQDESSMLVARLMNPNPGALIIDVCSAPGGKAAHMAELMDNKGIIIARDIHQHKLDLIEKTCKRLGISIINTQLFDAKKIDGNYTGKADGVLVDAPCSGLGLLRRKPDLRWKKKQDDLETLQKLQLEILKNASVYVKKGGTLIYSTCTLNKKENIEVVKKFLSSNDEFSFDSIEALLPNGIYAPNAREGYIELYPNIHNTDGFFISRMIRR